MQVCRTLAISEIASSSVTELYQTGRGKKASVIPMQSKRDFCKDALCCPYVKHQKIVCCSGYPCSRGINLNCEAGTENYC